MNSATSSFPGHSDLTLLARWGTGDRGAADELARRYADPLRDFFRTKARPADLHDLIQQVWVALSETLRRGPVTDIRTSLRAYVFGIARHVLFRHIRINNRLGDVEPIEHSIASLDPSLSQVVSDRVQAQRMTLVLQRLPIDVQILLELRYSTGMSTAELAELYSVPPGTIKSRLSHARKLLESAMNTS